MDKLRCPICRSRRWRREPSSGMLVCGEGHILQSYRNETTELTEMVGHVLRQRRTKNAKPATRRERANPAFYHGTRARFLYFQSLQLLLRLQIVALQKLWGLPPEFEAICKDLWALHLTMLDTQVNAESISETEDNVLIEELQPPRQDEDPPADLDAKDFSDSDEAPHSSEDEKAELDVEHHNDLADLLDGLSDDSSGEDEVGEEGETKTTREKEHSLGNEGKPQGNRVASKYTQPSSTLAVLVTACWMVRLPVIYMDFIRLIDNYTLPYLNVITRGMIPQSMMTHMNKSVILSLNVQVPPRPLQLHALSSRLARRLKAVYNTSVPEANAAHVLCRSVDALYLPAVFYHMAKVFADMLRIPLTLHPSLSPLAVNASGKNLNVQMGDNVPVEMSLICAVVLLLKLLYGLDGRPREVASEEEFLPGLPSQEGFLSHLRRDDGHAQEAETRTAMDLPSTDIDQYLEFCTRALLGHNARSNDTLLERTFPIPTAAPISLAASPWPNPATKQPDDSTSSSLTDSQEAETLLRGKHHTIYSTNDVLGDLPEDYRLVVSKAARWCGVESNDIALVVERFERRLLRDLERGPKSGSANATKRRDASLESWE